MELAMPVKTIQMAMVFSTNTMNAHPIHSTGLVNTILTMTKMVVEMLIGMRMTTVTTFWICQTIALAVK